MACRTHYHSLYSAEKEPEIKAPKHRNYRPSTSINCPSIPPPGDGGAVTIDEAASMTKMHCIKLLGQRLTTRHFERQLNCAAVPLLS